MDLIEILEVLGISMLVFLPFALLFNPKMKERMRAKNKDSYQVKNRQNKQ